MGEGQQARVQRSVKSILGRPLRRARSMPVCSWGVWKYPTDDSHQPEMWVTYKDKTKLAGRQKNVNFTLDRADTGEWSGSVGKESACNAGDLGSIPGMGRSLGERNVNPLQYLSWSISWIDEDRLSPWNCKESGHNCANFIFSSLSCAKKGSSQSELDWPTHSASRDRACPWGTGRQRLLTGAACTQKVRV